MTGSCPLGHWVTLTAGHALICSAVQAAGRLLRRRASTLGSTFDPSVEQPPTAMTTPVAERKTVSRYRDFISAPVCQVEEEGQVTVVATARPTPARAARE